MFESQAGIQAANLISEILEDRNKGRTSEPLTLQERLTIAQVCATLSIGHEINGLAQAICRLAEKAEAVAGVANAIRGVGAHPKPINIVVKDVRA